METFGTKPLLGPGRPRDTGMEARVLDDAVRIFGEHGWSGFSIEKVAASSGAGKASIYLRWRSKEELLLAALSTHLPDVEDVDTGTLREDLLQLTRQVLHLYFGPTGRAAERMMLDSNFSDGLAARLEDRRVSQYRSARSIVARAIARGELGEGTPGNLVLNVITGAATSYVQLTPRPERTRAEAASERFAIQLVDLVIRGIGVEGA